MRSATASGIREELERVHARVVPAEPAQHLGAQAQRLAQRTPDQHAVGLDDDAGSAVGGDQPELAAVAERDAQAARLEPAREVDEHRVAVVGERRLRAAGGHLIQDLGERDGAVLEPAVFDVGGREAGHDHQRAAGAGHRDREQALAAGLPERAEVAQHAAVRGAAVAEREHDAVAALGDGSRDRQHVERLGAVADDELGELRMRRHRLEDRLHHAHRVLVARGDDHERLVGALRRVLDHQLDDAVDLGVDALDGAGVGVRHPGAVLDVVEHEAAVARGTCPPRAASRSARRRSGG